MFNYKLSPINDCILRFDSQYSDYPGLVSSQVWCIPLDPANSDYQQFIQDVAEQGLSIVEGPDIIEPDYATLRSQEYPSREDQLDMMYWDKVNGTNIWEETIQAIKEKYPKTITGGTTIGPVPDWVMEEVNKYKSQNPMINT